MRAHFTRKSTHSNSRDVGDICSSASLERASYVSEPRAVLLTVNLDLRLDEVRVVAEDESSVDFAFALDVLDAPFAVYWRLAHGHTLHTFRASERQEFNLQSRICV